MRPSATAGAENLAAHYREMAAHARQPEQSRSREVRARRARGLVACMAFLGLLAASWMIGTKSFVSEPRDERRERQQARAAQDTPADRDAHAASIQEPTAGWIVYELRDGLSCTYIPFDNITQWVGEPSTTLCDDAARKQREGVKREFSWGR